MDHYWQRALATNIAFAAAVSVLLAWAALRFSPWIAAGLLSAIAAGLAAWFRGTSSGSRSNLEAALVEQARLEQVNAELRRQIEQAYRRGAEINERSLKRIGADLHDGPAQLLGLVLLKLDELALHMADSAGEKRGRETLDIIRRAATEALAEIRNTARGLILPDIEQVTLAAALELAVRSHEQRTRTRVAAGIGELPPHVPLPVTICLFRFVQEGLNNAFRHAGGKGQALTASYDGTSIVVEVADSGAGFDAASLEPRGGRLGLAGLKQRVQALGGGIEISSCPGQGTRLTARFRHPAFG